MILALAALGAVSCYEDLSTEATIELPEIEIITESNILNVAYGHDLVLDPDVVEEGRSIEDFDFLWEIDLTAGSKSNRLELGREKALTYRVSNSPSDKPYYLTLTVTDSQTGLQKMAQWNVYVSSSLGEGILVAYTRDGGQTSDLCLLANKSVTYGFEGSEALMTEGLYEFANGAPIDGRINTLVTSVVTNGAVFNETRVMVGTDEHLIAIDPISYSESMRDAALFNSKETFFGTTMLFNFADYCTSAIVGGRLFTCIGNFDRAYTKTPISSKKADVFRVGNIAYSKPDQGKVLVFNESDYKFHYATCLSVSGGMSAIDDPGLSYSLEGATALGGGCMKDMVLGMVLKLVDGSHHFVSFNLDYLNPTGNDYLLSGAKDIDNAVCFAFCDNANAFYYATEKKIYTVIISGGTATVKALSWQPETSGEKITSLCQFEQSWYGTSHNSFNDYPFVLDTHRLQMVITTYNESTGEGKIYLRPFSPSTGLFTMKDNGSYGGFGEITAIATTPR